MASYATAADLRRHLTGSTTPVSHTVGGQPDATLVDAVARGQAQVDSVLAGRYSLPLTNPPRLVVDITLALAAWHASLSFLGETQMDQREPVQLRYEWATKMLDGIAKGTVDLQLDADGDGEPDPTSAGRPRGINTVPSMFGPADFHLTDRWGCRAR